MILWGKSWRGWALAHGCWSISQGLGVGKQHDKICTLERSLWVEAGRPVKTVKTREDTVKVWNKSVMWELWISVLVSSTWAVTQRNPGKMGLTLTHSMECCLERPSQWSSTICLGAAIPRYGLGRWRASVILEVWPSQQTGHQTGGSRKEVSEIQAGRGLSQSRALRCSKSLSKAYFPPFFF